MINAINTNIDTTSQIDAMNIKANSLLNQLENDQPSFEMMIAIDNEIDEYIKMNKTLLEDLNRKYGFNIA